MKNKKAAMEMSVGTIVTIVLLMTVLILGLVLVRTIFKSSIENIDSIDQAVKAEITKLFAEDNTRSIVIYPPTREISVKKGDSGGFGFSLRNNEQTEGTFTYIVSLNEIASNCQMTESAAESLLILGRSGSIEIPSGTIMENPVLVKFQIPSSASLCQITYGIDIKKDGQTYIPTVSVILEIK